MSITPAQPMVDFSARFGNPRVQRYKVSDRLRLSLEYGADGKVSAIEIAPAGYRGYDPSQPLEMSSQTADRILENLLPGSTTTGIANETLIGNTHPGFSREVRLLLGASLNRDYPLGTDRTKMIAAGLVVTTADLCQTLSEALSVFGDPEYQQFSTQAGLAVGAFYGPDGLIKQIRISAEEPLLARPDYAKPIRQDAAQALLHEFFPPSSGTAKPQKGVFCSGAFRKEHMIYEKILLWWDYVNDDLVAAGAIWPQAVSIHESED